MRRTLSKLTLVCLIAFFSSKIINVLVYAAERELPQAPAVDDPATLTPALAALAAEDAAEQIRDRNLMHARRDDVPDRAEPADAEPPCSLQIVGIVAGNRSEWSYVLVRDARSGETEIFAPRAGKNRLPNGATLLDVRQDAVHLLKHGRIETCALGGTDSAPAHAIDAIQRVNDAEYLVARGELDRLLATVHEDVRVVPAFEADRAIGFKLFAIRAGSTIARAGLQNGDVVDAINGVSLTTPAAALDAYAKLKTSDTLTLHVSRRGAEMTTIYRLR